MPHWMIGLLVFDKKVDPISKYHVEASPFEFGLSKEQDLNVWAAVIGTPPYTVCLEDKKVHRAGQYTPLKDPPT